MTVKQETLSKEIEFVTSSNDGAEREREKIQGRHETATIEDMRV